MRLTATRWTGRKVRVSCSSSKLSLNLCSIPCNGSAAVARRSRTSTLRRASSSASRFSGPLVKSRLPSSRRTALLTGRGPSPASHRMEWGTRFIWERYGLPIYITENGLSCTDSIHLDGKVHDPARIDFTHRYLLALRRAIDSGVDVRGYFHWSLLDNFEWSEGYNERFGLIYLDYATGKRTPKDSAAWYAKVAETNGKNL